jgi:hypothetical protein
MEDYELILNDDINWQIGFDHSVGEEYMVVIAGYKTSGSSTMTFYPRKVESKDIPEVIEFIKKKFNIAS